MTYGLSLSLQKAVFQVLQTNDAVVDLSAGQIFEFMPPGPVPDLYVRLGPETVRDRSDRTARGAIHDFAVIVASDRAGFRDAKALAGAVSEALAGTDPVLEKGRVVALNFRRARARWLAAGREIELWFRAHLDDE